MRQKITVEPEGDTCWTVQMGGLFSGSLTWDEAIGTVSALLLPTASGRKFLGHMHPVMFHVQQEIRFRGLLETFGDKQC